MELICTGDIIDAHAAGKMGMVTAVVPDGQLESKVIELAEKLAGKSGSILGLGLEAYQTIVDMEYTKAIAYLKDMAAIVTSTPDSIEGTSAFAEKRKPKKDDITKIVFLKKSIRTNNIEKMPSF